MNSSKVAGWVVALIAIAGAAYFTYTHYFRIPTNVAYVTNEDGGISVIDLDTLQVVKRIHPQDVAPRGEGLTFDGKYLVTADKDTADAAVIDTRRMKVVRKLHVGDNPEFVKLDPAGQWLFTSYEPGSTGGPPGPGDEEENTNEPPSEVVEFNTDDWTRALSFVAGQETEGLEFSPDGKLLIVANEAQNNLGVYNVTTGQQVKNVNLESYGRRPRGVKVSPQGNLYAVTMEGSGTLLLLDANFNVLHATQTAAKPYGIAFDRDGRRIFVVAAAAQELQVFKTDTLQQVGEAPLGKRCWHFTFTPDDSKLLFACGRSNDVYVLDAKTYKQIKVIGGFQTPWGILTYPRAYGSLGLP
ncbi:MAG: beta-propeller fold lactonase family protein [Candidatus Acidiferrales bacterium]